MPTDRPIDGVDQTDVLFGKSDEGQPRQPVELHRRGFGGGERWKQWRVYFTDIHPSGPGPERAPWVLLRQRTDGRLSAGLQHRDGST